MGKIIYSAVRTYNLLLAIIPAIAFYRATVQPEYKWGLLLIHGEGTSSEYWILVIFMLFAWITFLMGTWYKKKWYSLMPVLLFGLVSVVLVMGLVNQKEMVFQGDVWQFKFDIGLVLVLTSFVLLIAGIAWAKLDRNNFIPLKFYATKQDKTKLLATLALSVIILLLFGQGSGGVHSYLDGIAVGLTVIQALLLAHLNDKTYKVKQI